MNYTDVFFLVLFGGMVVLTRLLRPWPVLKEWLIIAFSLFLIATWGLYDVTLFLVVILFNFVAALGISRALEPYSKRILQLFITLDLGTLVAFKYFDFLTGNIHFLSGWELPTFPFGIPIAISFYTFHLISYLVDLHAKRVRLASFREYIFYLSFFPHVIAGPIVRAWQLIPQIGHTRRVITDYTMGMHYMVLGFFLKEAVANNIAQAIDPVWNHSTGFPVSTIEYWLTAFLYYCQIYSDFAGYSLMALGMARFLGYRLPPNFRTPMVATGLREFWQRWHITLSRWLRDYLYIPLGGNRGSAPRVGLNLMLTMMLGGLWHGAGWGFLIWGFLHGSGLILERLAGGKSTASESGQIRKWRYGFLWVFLGWLFTQAWVTLAWIFFRSPDLTSALGFLGNMSHLFSWNSYIVHKTIFLGLICAVPVLLHQTSPWFLRMVPRRHLGWSLGGLTGLVLLLNIAVMAPSKSFIYFRF